MTDLQALRELSEKAYCDYIKQMRKPECLGFVYKLAQGTFGPRELAAHSYAGELLGRHRAFAEVLAQLSAPGTQEPSR